MPEEVLAEPLSERCLGINRNLDMRILLSGFADRLQFEAGETVSARQDLVWSRLMGLVVPAKESCAERLQREREIAHEIKDLPREERLRGWQEKTGKSKATLYRRLAELDGFSVDEN